mmetsp:Transcript_81448/g.174403  ORF Transcript_81448/g.174403 Transcript_81448/m.174403 type:complete len:209 (-) Transcript_81448:337-963(-)
MLSHTTCPRVREDRQTAPHALQSTADQACARRELQALYHPLHRLGALPFQHRHLGLRDVLLSLRHRVWVDASFLQDLVEHVVGAENMREPEDDQGLAARAIHCVPPTDGHLRAVAPRCLLQTRSRAATGRGGAHEERCQLLSLGATHSHLHLVVLAVVLPLIVASVLNLVHDATLLAEHTVEVVKQSGGDGLRGDHGQHRSIVTRRRP